MTKDIYYRGKRGETSIVKNLTGKVLSISAACSAAIRASDP